MQAFMRLFGKCSCTKPKIKDPDVSSSTSSLTGIQGRYKNNSSLQGSTGTLPSDKKTGFLKWLKKKGNGPNSSATLPPKSPKARKDKANSYDEGPSRVIKASSVQHLVSDPSDGDDVDSNVPLPPAMPIVDDLFPGNGVANSASVTSFHRVNHGDASESKESGVWRTSDDENSNPTMKQTQPKEVTEEERNANIQKRHYVLKELVDTEKDYVTDLGVIVNDFMNETLEKGLPESDNGKERVVFGNAMQLYQWHRDTFSKELQKGFDQPDYIGQIFKKYERRLQMYVYYCKNKPLSEFLVHRHKPFFAEIQEKFGHKLDIAGYLIKPVQRIMKYQLLLKDILKFTDRAGLDTAKLTEAVNIMHIVPKQANDMMTVARMQGYDGHLTAQGALLLQQTFSVRLEESGSGSTGVSKERKVFLFEQIVIFADLIDKKSEEKGFNYKNSIKCNNLILSERETGPTQFKLWDSSNSSEVYELTADSEEIAVTWVNQIRTLLDTQRDFVRALQAPIQYQQKLSPTHSANSNNNNNALGFSFSSSHSPNKNKRNLNYRAGGEGGRGEEPPTPVSVVSSFSDEITNALASRSPIFYEVSSPPWSKQNENEQTVKTDVENGPVKKSNLTLDLSSNAHCERVTYKTSPVMTPNGVLKLPHLTAPTSAITGAPATWNLRNCNDLTKTEVHVTAPPSEPVRRRLPSENGIAVSQLQGKKPVWDTMKSASNGGLNQSRDSLTDKDPGIPAMYNFPRHKPPSSVTSMPIYSAQRSIDQNAKDSSSVAGSEPPQLADKNPSKGTKKSLKQSKKSSKASEKELEKRRGRAKHRRLPGFFSKRSKTTDARSENAKIEEEATGMKRQPSPDLSTREKFVGSDDDLNDAPPKMDPMPKIEAIRTIHSNGVPQGTVSRSSVESNLSRSNAMSDLQRGGSGSGSIGSPSVKESFWLSPLSPAIKPGALDFTYPNTNSNSDVSVASRQCSVSGSQELLKDSIDSKEKSEKENGIVSMLAARDYIAKKEDEISVKQGDIIQILATNSEGKCLVHRPSTRKCPAAEGWIPGEVMGHTGNTLRRPSKRASLSSIESPMEGETMTPRSSQKLKGRRRLRKLSTKTLSAAQSLPSLIDTPEDIDGDSVSITSTPTRKGSVDAGKSTWASLRLRKSSSSKKLVSKSASNQDVTTDSDLPYFQTQLTAITVREGESVEMRCLVCGKPRPEISWKTPSNVLNGTRMTTSYWKDDEAVLKIVKAQIRDTGQYSCVATNEHGSATTSTTLTVQGPPGSVLKPKIVKTSKGSITVYWNPPNEKGNLPITSYTLEYVQAGSKKWQRIEVADPENTSYLVEDLSPGVLYKFRIIAHNAAGDSRPSELSQPAVVQLEKSSSNKKDGVVWKTDMEIHYSCTQLVARGRFSVVQELVSISSGNVFAGKFLNKRSSTKETAEREINILTKIQKSEFFLPLKEIFLTPLAYVLIFPMMPGGRLFEYLVHQKSVDLAVLAVITSQLLAAVSHIHNQDIVHLDIKPENILLRSNSPNPEIVLVDFGDAVQLKHGNGLTHQILGSPEFTAPEILRGQHVTPAADIWSVGVLVYTMFSGFSPFYDDSVEEMCSNICNGDFSFPDGYFSMVPDMAKDFIKSVLVQSPSTRPSAKNATKHKWLNSAVSPRRNAAFFPTSHLNVFAERRKNQHAAVPVPVFSR